jgi:hypothetical protein
MDPVVRRACEHLLWRGALGVAAAVDGTATPNLPKDVVRGALRFEMLDPRGLCQVLRGVESLLVDLEARDVADAGVQAELARLAPQELVGELALACAFYASAGDAPDVLALVLRNVDLSRAPSAVPERTPPAPRDGEEEPPPLPTIRLPAQNHLPHKSSISELQ